MTRSKQAAFVRALSRAVADEIVANIKAGNVPEEWDGHELRVLLAEKHQESASMSVLTAPRSRRMKRFRGVMATSYDHRIEVSR